ncbi:HigA family addiction module antitoxin [Rheinheimera sp.]|uniref:HigA family addiction module antitoxin n=1 Tax=Rheinheimera sp. TaxID=1869214 RepID=UPI002737138D|nr:HigA family addiction module antitoxin [Rheinheimera sp.]MDP2714571.1 HigA family addiction module antitoxin [Rheinheimera sp.]
MNNLKRSSLVISINNPPHPGALIKEAMEALDVSARKLALALDVAPSTVQRLISGKSDISPEMAIRLSAVIGSSERVWMGMQDAYDLWHARQKIDTSKLQRLCSA